MMVLKQRVIFASSGHRLPKFDKKEGRQVDVLIGIMVTIAPLYTEATKVAFNDSFLEVVTIVIVIVEDIQEVAANIDIKAIDGTFCLFSLFEII